MTMKTAIVSRSALSAALNTVRDVVEKRNTLAVLHNVRLIARDGVLLATGTDLDIETTAAIPAGAIDHDFAVTLPAHKLAEILKKAPAGDDLAIDAENTGEPAPCPNGSTKHQGATARLDFAGLSITMQGIAVEEFPEMGMSPEVKEFDVLTADFRDSLQRVAFAISTEETRYYLNGIYMHAMPQGNTTALRMVATDGHRMAHHNMTSADGSPVPDFGGVIVPRKTIDHLLKVTGKGAPETMRVIVNHQKVRFVVGNVTVVSKLIDGTFPDYSRVIPPNNDKAITLDRLAFAEAIKAVGCVSSERGRAVKLDFTAGNCRLTVNNPDMGVAKIDIPTVGDHPEIVVGFNKDYVLENLGVITSDKVTLRLSDSASPAIFEAGDGSEPFNRAGTFIVLMPMRV